MKMSLILTFVLKHAIIGNLRHNFEHNCSQIRMFCLSREGLNDLCLLKVLENTEILWLQHFSS